MFDPLIRYSTRHRGVTLALAVAAALAVVVLGEVAFSLANNGLTNVRLRNGARVDAMQLRTLLTDAETGQRGFLLTGREAYLEPMETARRDMAQVVGRLKAQYRGSGWDALVEQLNRRVLEKFSEMDTTVAMYRQNERGRWLELVRTDIGREKMDAVREATAQLEAYEAEKIASEGADVVRALGIGRIGVHVLALLTLLGFFHFLRKEDALQQARAQHAAHLAAERDRLDEEVRHRTEELSALARHLTSVREDERARLARELHDELGALLTAAKLDIARVRRMAGGLPPAVGERLTHMGGLIDDGIKLKRRIIEDLHPSALSNLGLVPALEILAREFAERGRLSIDTELVDVTAPEAGKLAIYRLVQEALTNILRHAQAQQVWIRLRADGQELVVSVRDDGRGFEPQGVGSGHHGLLGMRYRIEALRGVLTINAAPGRGTEVLARLPFTPSAA